MTRTMHARAGYDALLSSNGISHTCKAITWFLVGHDVKVGSPLGLCHRELNESNDLVEIRPAIESKLDPIRADTTRRMNG